MWFDYLILPLLIFLARICDVSIGTIRIILIAKGNKLIAPLLGFFEVLIWILAISRIMHNLDNWICYVAYAGGFATGNFIGMMIEEKLAMGVRAVRIVTADLNSKIMDSMLKEGFGVTFFPAEGSEGKVLFIYTIVQRQHIEHVKELINGIDPDAFYVIEDIRSVKNGVFISASGKQDHVERSVYKYWKKGT